jgi:two-component system, chemotaxis family, sensor kinase CheA
MATLDDLKGTFFEECGDLLQDMETGLTELQEGSGSDDTVNAVFRAVHSIKGGAGIFGFEALVKFAHVFETVLDAVRHGTLNTSQDVVAVLLSSSDMLSDLVTMSRNGDAVPPGHDGECRSALEQLLGGGSGHDSDDEPAPADFDGIDFTPVSVDGGDEFGFTPVIAGQTGTDDGGMRSFAIMFRPKPDMLKNANEPIYLLRELRKLGELSLVAESEGLPPLTELDPELPYIGWTGVLRTTADRETITQIFEFVVDDCELEIVESNSGPQTAAPEQDDAVAVTSTEPSHEAGQGAAAPAPTASSSSSSKPSRRQEPAGEDADPVKEGRTPPAKAGATTTRVELEKIDRVVNMVGELVISQAMLGQVVHDLPEHVSGRLMQILEEVIHHTRELKDSVMSMRAQPVRSVFQRMPRLVRELSTQTGKKVRLETHGESTEVDRTIIERLSDPLTHIIRNSVDHGVEAPNDRVAAGKPEEGTIRLSAEHRGGRIIIEISDDGAGVNCERVLKKAREKGLVDPEAVLNDDEIANLIFLPGFSTAEAISNISGRGVGMDVVRRNIQDLGGRVSLKSERGRGMTIQLAMPLTLAVMDGMVIKVGRETYVTPMSEIVECLRPARTDVHQLIGTRGMLRLRGDLVPLVHLGELLAVSGGNSNLAEGVVIITEAGEGTRFGMVVDELCGHQQVVIKSIEESYGTVPGIAAATILGNGKVAFILDIEKLSELATEATPLSNAA